MEQIKLTDKIWREKTHTSKNQVWLVSHLKYFWCFFLCLEIEFKITNSNIVNFIASSLIIAICSVVICFQSFHHGWILAFISLSNKYIWAHIYIYIFKLWYLHKVFPTHVQYVSPSPHWSLQSVPNASVHQQLSPVLVPIVHKSHSFPGTNHHLREFDSKKNLKFKTWQLKSSP